MSKEALAAETTDKMWRRRRVLAWTLSIVFWLALSGLHLTVAIAGLLIGAVIRGLYTFVSQRMGKQARFWSPYVFTISGLAGFFSLIGSNQ